ALPNLLQIFSELDVMEIYKLKFVCKQWKKVIEGSSLLDGLKATGLFAPSLVKYHDKLSDLHRLNIYMINPNTLVPKPGQTILINRMINNEFNINIRGYLFDFSNIF